MSEESLKDLFAVASVAACAEVTACPAALPASQAWGDWSPPASLCCFDVMETTNFPYAS